MSESPRVRIGVDLGGTKIEAVAFARDGAVLWRKRVPTPAKNYDAVIASVAELIEEAERELGVRASVGIGTPGSVSPATGLLRNSNAVSLIGQPFDRDLAARLQREVRIANDANCFVLSEAIDGAARDKRVVFGIILGTGAGGGIVIDRQVLVGRHAITGEWGHNPLPWPKPDELPGPLCYCGKHGCIETFVSGPGFERDFAQAAARKLSATDVAEHASQGDAQASAALDRYLDRLARALSNVINLLDPDVIVVGGGLSRIDAIYSALPARLPAYVYSDRVDTEIVRAQHGDASGVRGAAWLWA